MNEVIKTFKITLAIFMLISLFPIGQNYYQQKQAESYCEELKKLRSTAESLKVRTSTIEVEEALHNCQ